MIKSEGQEKEKKTEKKTKRESLGDTDEKVEDRVGVVGCNRNQGAKNKKETDIRQSPSSH